MSTHNIASGDDVVALQVGQIIAPGAETVPQPTPAPADDTPTNAINIRSGNARVGMQADVVTGDLWL